MQDATSGWSTYSSTIIRFASPNCCNLPSFGGDCALVYRPERTIWRGARSQSSEVGLCAKAGRVRDYVSAYLRETYRDGGKVKTRRWPTFRRCRRHVIDWIVAGA
jgi:hypothetical protein